MTKKATVYRMVMDKHICPYGLSTYENKFIRYEQGCLAVCEVTKKKATCSFPKNEDGIFD